MAFIASEFLEGLYVFKVPFGPNSNVLPSPVINNTVLAVNNSGALVWASTLPSAVQVGVASLNNGIGASSSTFWRGDGQWVAVSSGGGSVNSGTINNLGFYAATGTTISPLATANNGTLITNGSGVPSISSTLPAAVQGNITSLGTIASGVWHGSIIPSTYGGTGVNNGSSTLTLGGSLVTSGAGAVAITILGNTAVTMPTSGILATTADILSTAVLLAPTSTQDITGGYSLVVHGGFSGPGNIQALGGNFIAGDPAAGTAFGAFLSYPGAFNNGYLAFQANTNSIGNFATVLTTAPAIRQSQFVYIPDIGSTTANFIMSSIFGGVQTLTSSLILASGSLTANAGAISSGVAGGGFSGAFTAYSTGATLGSISLVAANNAGNFANVLTNASTSAARTWTLPDTSGTIALVGGSLTTMTLTGDSGTATGSSIALHATTNSGSTVRFAASGATINLNVTSVSTNNTIIGNISGNAGITGIGNTSLGKGNLASLTSGSGNFALATSGFASLTTGNNNIGFGSSAGANYTGSESSNILFNNSGVQGESATWRAGAGTGTGLGQLAQVFFSGINGVTSSNPVLVTINSSTDQLGVLSLLSPALGGTGVNNGTNTLTLAGNITTAGAFASTFTMTAATAITFPVSGTLATTAQLPSLPLSLANGGTGQNLGAVNNAVFSTTSGGVAQLSTTLPSGLSATNITLITPALGTPSAAVLTNATGLVPSTGLAASGTPSSSNYLRGDNTWSTIAGSTPNGVSKFVVDSQGGAQYTTVQAAITAAAAIATSTTPQTVWIWDGTYTENLTLAAYVNLAASNQSGFSGVNIIGNADYSATGNISISNITFTCNNSSAALSCLSAGAANVQLQSVAMNGGATPGAGFVCNSASTQAIITNGYFVAASGGQCLAVSAGLVELLSCAARFTDSASDIIGGNVTIIGSDLQDSFDVVGGSLQIYESIINPASTGSTLAGIALGSSGTAICVQSSINSTNTSGLAVSGTGIFSYSDLVMLGSANILQTTLTFGQYELSPQRAVNFVPGLNPLTPGGNTIVLTVQSHAIQHYSGSGSADIMVLPVTSTLSPGQPYKIINQSTATVLIESSNTTPMPTLIPGSQIELVCISNAGAGTPAEWQWVYTVFTPPVSASASLAIGTAYQNSFSYDILLVVYLNVTSSVTASVQLGVGPTSTPGQQTIINSVTLSSLAIIPVSIYIPSGYFALLTTSGTITASISGQIAMAA